MLDDGVYSRASALARGATGAAVSRGLQKLRGGPQEAGGRWSAIRSERHMATKDRRSPSPRKICRRGRTAIGIRPVTPRLLTVTHAA